MPRIAPNQVQSAAINKFLNSADEHEMHSLIIAQSGKVIYEYFWEPYRANARHQLFSLSKSFTSIALGMLIDEGRANVDMKLSEIFVKEFEEHKPEISENMRKTTLKNLLTMASGMDYEAWASKEGESAIVSFLTGKFADEPGQTFRYSSIATYICSAALTRITGESLVDFLKPRLFEPLGCENYFWSYYEADGANAGGFGLSAPTETIAKFGVLLANGGEWKGKRLVSKEYISEATKKQISNGDGDHDWSNGYGYQFWICKKSGVYRGDGMFGQYMVINESAKTVIAATSNVDMGKVMGLFSELLTNLETPNSELKGDCANYSKTHLIRTPSDNWREFFGEYDFCAKDGTTTRVCFESFDDELIFSKDNHAFLFSKDNWTHGVAPSLNNRIGFPEKILRFVSYGSWQGSEFRATLWWYEAACKFEIVFKFSKDFSKFIALKRSGGFDATFEDWGTGKIFKI